MVPVTFLLGQCILLSFAILHCHSFLLPSTIPTSISHRRIRLLHTKTQHDDDAQLDNDGRITTTTSPPDAVTTTALLFQDDENDIATTKNAAARAGRDGYSLLRQPLQRDTWDSSKDPTFATPKRRDDDVDNNNNNNGKRRRIVGQEDIEWWESSSTRGGRSSSSSSSFFEKEVDQKVELDDSQTGALDLDEIDSSSLNLLQRSFDTLDFPLVLGALRSFCSSVPAKDIVDQAQHEHEEDGTTSNNKDNNNNKEREPVFRLIADTPQTAKQRYQAVREMQWLLRQGDVYDDNYINIDLREAYYKNRRGYQVTIGTVPFVQSQTQFDLESVLDIAEKGHVLEGPDLLEVSIIMNILEDVQLWSRGLARLATARTDKDHNNTNDDDDHTVSSSSLFVELPRIAEGIELNMTLQNLLEEAFDENGGQLSSKTFPVLGKLRAKVRTLKGNILRQLDELVQLPSIRSKLALESGGPLYSEVTSGGGGRLVLPVDSKYASTVGITHDSSRSGRTVYVEPNEIIEPTNELRQVEHELKMEEERIWQSLTEQVWSNRRSLRRSVKVVAQLDLAVACCRLGENLGETVIPTVGDEGFISLRNAKHPVLLLKKSKKTSKNGAAAERSAVVGSEISLGENGNQGLVLTGPNSGGKTVILKLLGLCALMARCGIPIPASPSASGSEEPYEPRVDFFNPVLADIGDIQSVGSDLSTFSGHMLVCREVLAEAQKGKNALVLMDELGSGTDPAQGVAIAQALLEALLETGCRVAITTHYTALKQLATSDSRFDVAGMQFLGGKPTYKLLPGSIGESFALAVAERLKLPQTVLDRANDLLDSETRQMGDLIRDLEEQKAVIDNRVAEIEERKREIAALELKMKEEQIKLENKMLTARRDEAKKFAKKLEEKEKILEDVLEKLKSDPSRKLIAKSWEEIKFVKRDAINDAENVPSVQKKKKSAAMAAERAQQELVPLAEIRNRDVLEPNEVLTVCKPGSLFGRSAKVIKDYGKIIEVEVSGLPVSLKQKDLSMVPASEEMRTNSRPHLENGKKKTRMSKSVEMALMTETKGSGSSTNVHSTPRTKSLAMRMESNTVDVRGSNLEAAKGKIESKISKSIMNGQNTVYILHGHGSGGVLKSKLRGWLKTQKQLVKQWAPADASDGGDAFTRLEL